MDRVTDEADPNRCKGSVGHGQCMYAAVEGSDYCRVHARAYAAPEKGMRRYLFAKAADQARLAQLSEGDDIKSLREEMSLVTMMIEEQWNTANTPLERQQMHARINTLLQTLDKLTKTSSQLEERRGSVLAKATLYHIGQQICLKLIERLGSLPNAEQLLTQLHGDVISVIRNARNNAVHVVDAVSVPVLPPPPPPADSSQA